MVLIGVWIGIAYFLARKKKVKNPAESVPVIPPATIPFSPGLTDREKHELAYTKTLEFLREIRAKASQHLGAGREIPLVAYTAADPEYEALFRSEGVDAIVYKVHVDN